MTVAAAAGNPIAYFGDGEANLYAVDAEDGKLVWKMKIDSHPYGKNHGRTHALSTGGYTWEQRETRS